MPAETHLKVSGAWNKAKKIHVNVGGTWQPVKTAWAKVGGTWQKVFSACTSYELFYDGAGNIWISWTYCDGSAGSIVLYDGPGYENVKWNEVCVQDGTTPTVNSGSATPGGNAC